MGSLSDYFNRVMNGPPYRPGEEMKYEAIRLGSFKEWPHWARAQPTLLAKAGFYFTGTNDEVCCFACQGKLKEWDKGDDPTSEHRRWFPECPYVSGQASENVPLDPQHNDGPLESAVRRLPERNMNGQSPSSAINLNESRLTTASLASQNYQNKYEANRRRSFTNWPVGHTCPISPEELAKAGFYFLGEFDRVRCAFCQGTLRNWETGDSAIIEHKKHFPYCPFMCMKDVGNVPMISEKFRKRVVGTAGLKKTVSLCSVKERPESSDDENNQADVDSEDEERSMRNRPKKRMRMKTRKKESESTDELKPEVEEKLQYSPKCLICCENDRNCLLLPCGHFVCCGTCSKRVDICPYCRCKIRGTVDVYCP